MKDTGHIVTPEELAEAMRLLKVANETPDMTTRGMGPTWREQEFHALQMFVDSLAVARGLPAERSWGLRPRDGMIVADDTWDGTGAKVSS